MGLTYAISIVNWIFGKFFHKKYFLHFFNNFKLLIFHNNIGKNFRKFEHEQAVKICIQTTYPIHFCQVAYKKRAMK